MVTYHWIYSLIPSLDPLPGLRGVSLEEHLKLGGVTAGGDNEVSRLMKTGCRAVPVVDRTNRNTRDSQEAPYSK